jgi:dihydroorotate dehydrogenase electron transfer subunit
MPSDVSSTILRNVDLGHGNHLIEFEAAPEVRSAMEPGQFFMIGVPGGEVLLRRPFSVCGLPGTFEDGTPGAVQVLYRVYGRGTTVLASLAPGAAIAVLGPLGRGFELPQDPSAPAVFVAGGIGSAPFPALAHALSKTGRRPVMLYGARSETELPLLDWFERSCSEVIVATDDGSRGRRGFVTVLLEDLLARPHGRWHLYACGPNAMLKAVAKAALARGVRCDLSLEAPMACGFGVCLGCVLPCHDGKGGISYDRCCVEGPVMNAEKLAW